MKAEAGDISWKWMFEERSILCRGTKCRHDSANIRDILSNGGGCKVPSSDGIGSPSCAASYAWSAACGCPLPSSVSTTGVSGSIELLLKLVDILQHLYPIIQAGSEIMSGRYCPWKSTLQQVHDFAFYPRLS